MLNLIVVTCFLFFKLTLLLYFRCFYILLLILLCKALWDVSEGRYIRNKYYYYYYYYKYEPTITVIKVKTMHTLKHSAPFGINNFSKSVSFSCNDLILNWLLSELNTVEPVLWGHPFCIRKMAFQEGWFLVRCRNQYLCLDLQSSGLSRGAGLSSGWPLKRGSTVHHIQSHLKLDSKFAAADWRIALGSHCLQPNRITIDCRLKCAYCAIAVRAWLALSSACCQFGWSLC